MINKEMIAQLRQSVSVLDACRAALLADIETLSTNLKAQRFPDAAACQQVKEELSACETQRAEIMSRYAALGIGELPDSILAAQAQLEQLERKLEEMEREQAVFGFFDSLHSDDAEVEAALTKERQIIKAALKQKETDTETYAQKLELIRMFNLTVQESDERQRFSMMLQLHGKVSDTLLYGIHARTIVSHEGAQEEAAIESESPQPAPEPETVQEEPVSEEDPWEAAGIADPVAVCRSFHQMDIVSAVKCKKKFSVKEFLHDMEKPPMTAKGSLMIMASVFQGMTMGGLKHWYTDVDQLELGLEKLERTGYLEAYRVDGFETLFSLSRRGRKVFHSRDSLALLREGAGVSFSVYDDEQLVPRSAADVVKRIVALDTLRLVHLLDPQYEFDSTYYQLREGYYIHRIPELMNGQDVLFCGVIADDPQAFLRMRAEVQMIFAQMPSPLIVSAADAQASSAQAEWIAGWLPAEIYHAGYHVDTITALQDEETIVVQPEPESSDEPEAAEETRPQEPHLSMIADTAFYAASAWLRAAAMKDERYQDLSLQLAYAMNDPMERCHYSADQIFDIYFNRDAPDELMLSAVLRNDFMNDTPFDYQLQQLQDALLDHPLLTRCPALERTVFTLFCFKRDHRCGIDRYADYREQERAEWESRMESVVQKAKDYYEHYFMGNTKENVGHKRYLETVRLLFSTGGDLAQHLDIAAHQRTELNEVLADYVQETFVKDGAEIRPSSLDSDKIEHLMDEAWKEAGKRILGEKKTSDLMSHLRMNLYKRLEKIALIMCEYVWLSRSGNADQDDPLLPAYRKAQKTLLVSMQEAQEQLSDHPVLRHTLQELQSRLSGDYDERVQRYYYIDFLRGEEILLDEDYMPVLEDVADLSDLSCLRRIEAHVRQPRQDWMSRFDDIFKQQDDYGSASLILSYLREMKLCEEEQLSCFDLEMGLSYCVRDIKNKRDEFIEDMELAQSYGQIDNTEGDRKEMILQIADIWYEKAMQDHNFGFYRKVLEGFRRKVREDARERAEELHARLGHYLTQTPEPDELVRRVIGQIEERIDQQNYAAAEDLLNRLSAGDIDADHDLHLHDDLQQFLQEYEMHYKKTCRHGASLQSLVPTAAYNRDSRGASRLIEAWPKSNALTEAKAKDLLTALGFAVDKVKKLAPVSRIENFHVILKRPENGQKNHYRHPIAAFGSEAENKGFRLVYLLGKSDTDRLIDTFEAIGSARPVLVVLDCALQLAQRRQLARKLKEEHSEGIFAVIDRVVITYLSAHYADTAVNRMLMALIMPFAYCQPYIEKSADIIPPEMFIGRKEELDRIISPTGANLVYGGRQLGKSALLQMAKNRVDRNENGDRAIIIDLKGLHYQKAARKIAQSLYDEGILTQEYDDGDWDELGRAIRKRLNEGHPAIPYLLLMLDEADDFIASCDEVKYHPFEVLKDIQSNEKKNFKFVVAGLRNVIRFRKQTFLSDNNVFPHLESLTIMPFRSMEARELLEIPLYYLGFRFEKNEETESLISTILGTTNYFPGLLQLYCSKLIQAMRKDYGGYLETQSPPYLIRKEHIKKVLAQQSLQQEIRDKFFITLKVDEDDYYYLLALLAAYHVHSLHPEDGTSVRDLNALASDLGIEKIAALDEENISALLEEMRELNVLQSLGNGRYRFARQSFLQMMGTMEQIEDALCRCMEDA